MQLYLRILSVLALVFPPLDAVAQQWPLAPTNAAHVFDHCIGGYQRTGFHGAIDLPAPAGTKVYPIIAGVVRGIQYPDQNNPDAGQIAISAAPDRASPSWVILHLTNIPTNFRVGETWHPTKASQVALNFVVGEVYDWPASSSGIQDHIHVEKVNGTRAGHATIVNPLAELKPIPTMNARIDPTLFKRDGSANTAHDFNEMVDAARVVGGDVDFVNHSTTDVSVGGRQENNRAEINAIGYKIQGQGNVQGTNVAQRYLFDFTRVSSDFNDKAKMRLAYDEAHRNNRSYYFNYFIVTNGGKYTDLQIRVANDAIGNIIRNAWQTRVDKTADDDDDMPAATGEPGGDAAAPNNARAKYPDGRYLVTVTARTFNPQEAEVESQVYVNNFSQTIQADTTVYRTDEPVFVNGENYMAATTYTIYLIRRDTWPEHAPIPHGAVVAQAKATSDSDGKIPSTRLWAAYQPNGVPDLGYDIVVDYDGDGEYHLPKEGHTVDALNHVTGLVEIDK